MSRLRALGPWVRAGVTLGVLGALVHFLGSAEIVSALAAADPRWIALSALALSAQIVLSALRWQVTARALGIVIGRGRAVQEYYLSVLGNALLPGGVLGDLGRVMRMRAHAGLAGAARSVVIERLAGQVALLALVGCGALVWFWPASALHATLGGVFGLGAVLGMRVARPGGGVIGRMIALLHRAWVADGIWRAQTWLSVAILGCNIAAFWAAAQAVGVSLGVGASLYLLPLTLLAMLVPITVAGWGLREGAAALLWPLAGVAPALAVAASIVFGASALLAALPGLVGLARRAPQG